MKAYSIIAVLAAFTLGISASAQRFTKAAATAAVPEPVTTVAGIMVSNDTWDKSSPESGVYYIEVKSDGKITPQYRSAAMAEVVSALKKDNIMYTAEASSDFSYYYRQMSVSDWSTIGSRQEIDVEDVPAGWTYDATLGKAYGSFWNDNYQGFSFFGSFNLSSASWTSIDKVQRDERDIFALASDGKGTIYCLFGAYNYLATIDPVTGQVNRIKTTGFEIDTNWAERRVSSMCYDAENDRLIATVAETLGWGANKSYKSGLYIINPHTGDVEQVMDFTDNACFAGLYVVDAAPDAEAPGEPTLLTANVTGTAVEGTFSFVMPTATMGGAPLSGPLTAIVNVNGAETPIFDLTPGQKVTTPTFSFVNGTNSVKVTIADTQRRGGSASLEFWAGEDSPAAATNVAFTVGDGNATITWTAPATGAHGGPINPANTKYRIVRMPENRVVATDATGTSFVDANLSQVYKIIYYVVTAYNTAGEAEPAESNRGLSAGSFTVPFIEGFNSADDFALWTIEDANGGSTWRYYTSDSEQAADYEYDSEKRPADDWLISPPIRLETGKAYKISYKWRVMMKAYPESFEIMLGTSSNAASMSTLLGRHANVSNTAYQSADNSFTVDADGDYYIGLHCFSSAYMYILRVDDIAIDEMDKSVPATVTDLQIIPAAGGARAATIKFTAPRVDASGAALKSITSVTIKRNGTQIAELTNVSPGDPVVYEDKTVSSDAFISYAVSCANASGSGVAAVAEAYVGVDAPGAVRSLSIAESDNRPVLTWEAPSTGVNGGWFDSSSLTYRIVRNDGKVVAEACADTRFADTSYNYPSAGQDAVWYLVTPYCGTTKGAYAQTELLLCGKPYQTPAAETFPNADMTYYPWISQSDNAINYAWTLDNMGYNPQVSDQNGDRGLATFHSVGEPAGTVSYFYSPKFDISSLANPVVSFYLYHAPGEGAEKTELLIAAGTDTFSPLAGAPVINRTASTGWTRYAVILSDYKSAPWIRIGFKATGDGVADIYLDNFELGNLADFDLALTALHAPVSIAAGEQIRCSATVVNTGANTASGAIMKVTDGQAKELATINLPDLAPGADRKIDFTIEASTVGNISINATIVFANDGNSANNSLSASVKVVTPKVNAPTNLAGTIDENGTLTLSWDSPANRGAVTDDIESYTDWAIDGIGGWTMWDGDYDVTYMINTSYGDYPNSTARKAFQVCNPKVLGIDIWDEGKPHSGNKMLMAMCSMIYVNNDWLISPELNGQEQWVSFFARSFTLQNTPAERMRFWYSTTDNDPANFTEITTSYVELPGSWLEYRYYLPEGTKHFAINCVSDGAFAMFVDDLCFNDLTVPTWTLQHYEIFRDGQKIGETAATSCVIDNCETGTFTVKAIYDRGESPLSAGLKIDSGTTDEAIAGIDIQGRDGEIVITGASGLDIEIATADGVVVYQTGNAPDTVRRAATPGIYIVRAGATVAKIAVR